MQNAIQQRIEHFGRSGGGFGHPGGGMSPGRGSGGRSGGIGYLGPGGGRDLIPYIRGGYPYYSYDYGNYLPYATDSSNYQKISQTYGGDSTLNKGMTGLTDEMKKKLEDYKKKLLMESVSIGVM